MSPAADPQYGWLLGRVAGIPVYIGRSWPIIAVVVVMTFGPQLAGALPGGAGYAVAAAYALLLLVSVLVHEAGHALAARSTGSEVSRIVANLWGGHTVFGSGQRRPGTAALIAIAGPAGNLLLAGVGWLLLQVDLPAVPALLAWALAFSNVFVAVFNLLPGLPLDGGFVVEAVVWKVTGDRWLAMVVAGWLGRVVTVLAVVYLLAEPLLSGGRPSLVTIVWVALIGAFLWQGATQAIRAGTARRAVARVRVGQVLRPVVVVPGSASAATALEGFARLPGAQRAVLVDPMGTPVGFLDLAALSAVPVDQLPVVPATAVLVRPPSGWVVQADPGDDASLVVSSLAGHVEGENVKEAVLVCDSLGQLIGTVSLADVEAALR